MKGAISNAQYEPGGEHGPGSKRKLRPVVDEQWRLIGPSPDIDSLLTGPVQPRPRFDAVGRLEKNAAVDHHIFQGPDGAWHCWGCIRATSVGRVFYHWEAESFADAPWRMTGEIIRADRAYGESLDPGDECIMSPFIFQDHGTYYMVYGGGGTGKKENGPADNPKNRYQICMMSSRDGRTWVRSRNKEGKSQLFEGPGPARDPFVCSINGLWHLYYCGVSKESHWTATVFLRTSDDLIHWSDYRIVHLDAEGVFATATKKKAVECPFVVYRDGYFYLFRTVDYYSKETYVFRSEDPLDFGISDPRENFVCRVAAAAPEIYTIEGQEYISSSHNPPLGEQVCGLRWIPDE